MLVVDFDGPAGAAEPTLWCSGSVIADDAFLTAAHCITAVPPEATWAVTLAAGAPGAPASEPGVFPDEFPFPPLVPTIAATEVVLHPKYRTKRPTRHDVAVIRVPDGTFAGIAPITLPRVRHLNRLRRSLMGRSVTLVGYGLDPEGEVLLNRGYRQRSSAPVLRLESRLLILDARPEVTGQGAGCLGDSGSPQFLDGIAVSVLSVLEACRGEQPMARLDTPQVLRFLARFTG
jgi:hypothetical protein